jgi:glycosyltransferase involved in cell wall biosynthesis
MMKVLILVPQLDKPGGVANYYTALKSKFSVNVDYFTRGARSQFIRIPTVITYLYDYLAFFFNLVTRSYSLYVINTSLAYAGCTRDRIFIYLCKLFNKKFIVFFRGWNEAYAEQISKSPAKSAIKPFLAADAIIVLADDFKTQLREWGYEGKIYIETTVVDSKLLDTIDFSYLQNKHYGKPDINLLFLARVVKEKGVYELIRAYDILQNSNLPYTVSFTFAGTGPDLDEIKSIAKKENLNITFTGHITGLSKQKALQDADIFLFPTNHGEGMPNSLLEAMAFGLPILTRPVGGIKDFFIDEKMGRITTSTDPLAYAEILKEMISDPSRLQEVSQYNHKYALERFTSEKVATRLEQIFLEVTHEDSRLLVKS